MCSRSGRARGSTDPGCGFANAERAQEHALRFCVAAKLLVDAGKIAERDGVIGMAGIRHLLVDGDRAPLKRLGLRVTARVLARACQIVEPLRDFVVVGAEPAFTEGKARPCDEILLRPDGQAPGCLAGWPRRGGPGQRVAFATARARWATATAS
jgi:hypothetical protein